MSVHWKTKSVHWILKSNWLSHHSESTHIHMSESSQTHLSKDSAERVVIDQTTRKNLHGDNTHTHKKKNTTLTVMDRFTFTEENTSNMWKQIWHGRSRSNIRSHPHEHHQRTTKNTLHSTTWNIPHHLRPSATWIHFSRHLQNHPASKMAPQYICSQRSHHRLACHRVYPQETHGPPDQSTMVYEASFVHQCLGCWAPLHGIRCLHLPCALTSSKNLPIVQMPRPNRLNQLTLRLP